MQFWGLVRLPDSGQDALQHFGSRLQEQLLWEGDLRLDRCLDMGHAAKISRERMTALAGTTAPEVRALRKQQRREGGQGSMR